MLLLDSRCALIDGVSVFPDHADPLQWFYLPTSPHVTTLDGTPAFQLDRVPRRRWRAGRRGRAAVVRLQHRTHRGPDPLVAAEDPIAVRPRRRSAPRAGAAGRRDCPPDRDGHRQRGGPGRG